jgi:predicted alpha/beta-hydrolase family hydrolase
MADLFIRPPDAWLLYVLAHGAGAGMRHRFLDAIANALATKGVATFRYQFPYMDAGAGRPDPPGILETSVREAVVRAAAAAPDLPLIAGGKSLGGRMTSGAAAASPLPGVKGLVFLGFPLHAPGQLGIKRADHLDRVNLPMLFLQGTRDTFARPDLLLPVIQRLGPRATLHSIEGGDHSFAVLKRSGRSADQVMVVLVDTVVDWARTLGLGGKA